MSKTRTNLDMSDPQPWKLHLPSFKTLAQTGLGLVGMLWALVSFVSQNRYGRVEDGIYVLGVISAAVFFVGAVKCGFFYASVLWRRRLNRMETERIEEGQSVTAVNLLRVSPLIVAALVLAVQKVGGVHIPLVSALIPTRTDAHPAFVSLATGLFVICLVAALVAKDHFTHKDRAMERRLYYALLGAACLGGALLVLL